MATCPHESTYLVSDVPIADPETYDFQGRFDIRFCTNCKAEVDRVKKPN